MLDTLADYTPVIEPAGERGKVFLGMDGLGRLYGSPPNHVRHMLRAVFQVFPAPLVAATREFAPGTFVAWVVVVRARPGDPVVVADDGLADFLAAARWGPCPCGGGHGRASPAAGGDHPEVKRPARAVSDLVV